MDFFEKIHDSISKKILEKSEYTSTTSNDLELTKEKLKETMNLLKEIKDVPIIQEIIVTDLLKYADKVIILHEKYMCMNKEIFSTMDLEISKLTFSPFKYIPVFEGKEADKKFLEYFDISRHNIILKRVNFMETINKIE